MALTAEQSEKIARALDGVSAEAVEVCAKWFANGAKCTLRSHQPHEVLSRHRKGMDELVAAGIVTRADFNQHGSLEFTGTERAGEIGRARHAQIAVEMGLFA